MIKIMSLKVLSYISNKIRTEEKSICSCIKPLSRTKYSEHQ